MATKTAGIDEPSDMAGDGLVGREADLARLETFLAGIPRDGGAMMLLGDPGVGKSALLAATVRKADALGMRVLRSVGVQYTAQAGSGALRQLLNSSPDSRFTWETYPSLPPPSASSRAPCPATKRCPKRSCGTSRTFPAISPP